MTVLELVLIVGAVARLTRLLQTDTILDRPRARVRTWLGDWKVAELLWCPWCLSVWLGALVAVSWWAWGTGRWWLAVMVALTASMATGLLNIWEDR